MKSSNVPKLMKSADNLAKAYRAWIMANAEYNSLLSADLTRSTYTINWADGAGAKSVSK